MKILKDAVESRIVQNFDERIKKYTNYKTIYLFISDKPLSILKFWADGVLLILLYLVHLTEHFKSVCKLFSCRRVFHL